MGIFVTGCKSPCQRDGVERISRFHHYYALLFFANTIIIANQMRDADLGLGSVPIACLEDLLNDCMNLMVMSSSDVTSNASLEVWHLTESSTVLGMLKEDMENHSLDIFGEILSGMVAEVGAAVRRELNDDESVRQWTHALSTFLSWDEYCQMTTAQLTAQYQEELTDLLMDNPRMSQLARRMDTAMMEAIRQVARGVNIEPENGMKFLHSLVMKASKVARDLEMDHTIKLRRMTAPTEEEKGRRSS